MTEVSFYHLVHIRVELVLSTLLEKTMIAGERALVLVGTEARGEFLASSLWTYDPSSWLPHGTVKDGCPNEQPIWLAADDFNPNGATFLFLIDGTTTERLSEFKRCFELFDGNDPAMVEVARNHWRNYKEGGHHLIYWQHKPPSGWEIKAEHIGE